jgi:hypothetical protein
VELNMTRGLKTQLAAMVIVVAAPASAAADVVVDWNRIMLSTVAAQNPFAQARFAAITQLAVFDAVNACTRTYEPYLGGIFAATGASPEAAAIVAAHDVLKNSFPAAAPALDTAMTQSLAAIPDGQAKSDGMAVGAAAAAAMIANRATDHAIPPQTFVPDNTQPGTWQPTPPLFGPGILLNWRDVTPFGIASSDQFRSGPPPALTSGQYTKAYREVLSAGDVNSTIRLQDRTDVARFFAAASAAYAWNMAVQQVSAAFGLSLAENARAFALLNMSISDGLVASMETKYHYVFWRPVTAIRAGDLDENRHTDSDPSWTPLVTTPSFPSYPSAHASASYAARRVAELLFNGRPIPFTLTHPALPGVTLTYASFRELTDDIDDARVYGGIHFRFDQEAGAIQGKRIGRYIFKRWFRPVGD